MLKNILEKPVYAFVDASRDGDFLPVLKYLKSIGKEVIILARGSRTAKEIRQFAGSNFRDFGYLKYRIKFNQK